MLKRIVRKAIMSTKAWLQEPLPTAKSNSNKSIFAYDWLNTIVEDIIAELGPMQRPNYTWGMAQGAHLAKMVGIERISVIEFGVAGGNGLVALDRSAEKIEKVLGVGIDVYGFDAGAGLPKPVDYRDLPNLWSAGDFPMDEEKLRRRLKRAELILGFVEKTVPVFIKSRPSPIAFISFDVDLYSSTMHALKLIEADAALLMPRIHCYFDDIMGLTFGDHNGERLAISEFNTNHPMRKISPIYGLRFYVSPRHANVEWVEKFYMAHILDHELYGVYDGLIRQKKLDLR